MRKSQILKGIESELTSSNNLNRSLLEIRLTSMNEPRNKSRLAYCFLTGQDTADQVKAIIRDAANNYFQVTFSLFATIAGAKLAHTASLSDPIVIENNWRGRLFSSQSLISQATDIEAAQHFLFDSVWRIIVQRDNSQNYYVRYDIFPYFWNPGHSTGGKRNFEDALTQEFWSVIEPRVPRYDIDFDKVKIFAKREDQNTFPSVSYSPVGTPQGQEDYALDFSMTKKQKVEALRNILDRLRTTIFHN